MVHFCHYYVHYFRHSFNRYPALSEQAFGSKGGCFEKPSDRRNPQKDIDCPDVLPLQFSDNIPNREAMRHKSPLVHPDVNGTDRYCLGKYFAFSPRHIGRQLLKTTIKLHFARAFVE